MNSTSILLQKAAHTAAVTILFGLIFVAFAGAPCYAQAPAEVVPLRIHKNESTSPKTNLPKATANSNEPTAFAEDPSPSEMPPAVARELAALRERIDQLETELRARPAANRTAEAESSSKPTVAAAVVEPAKVESTSASRTPPDTAPPAEKPTQEAPFSYADWTWLNGTARTRNAVWDSQYFTPEFRIDTHFMQDYNQPKDHTMGGSTESFRSGEVQLEQLSFGGDLHVGNVRGRILTMYLLPPINGATAVSGSPYFPATPGSVFKGWDTTATFDWMPSQYITFRFETGYRHANVPYWSGRGGITPPGGNVSPVAGNGSVGTAASYICTNGSTSAVSSLSPSGNGFAADNAGGAVTASCVNSYGSTWNVWQPDLRRGQLVNTIAILVKF